MSRLTRTASIAIVALVVAASVAACGDDVASNSTNLEQPAFSEGALNSNSRGGKAVAAASTAAASATSAAAAPPGPASNPALAAAFDRKIVFSASLTLEARDVTAAFNLAGRVAANAGGYVEKSSFSGASGDASKAHAASLTLRVPATQYQPVLADLRGLDGVTVKQESAKSTEVTEQYTDLQSRLRNLEQTEQQYLGLLAQAKTIDDILKMTDRVNAIREQVEQVQGRINLLDHLSDLATIDLSITPLAPAKVETAGDHGPKGVSEAFADAWAAALEGARYVAAAGAVLAVAAAWLALPVGLVFLGARLLRRRGLPVGGPPGAPTP